MNRPFVNGNREQTNNFIVDGFDVNETIDNRVAYQPSPDALAEISVETNNYSADTGNVGGAVVANVIKSGTNQYRGNVFEFYRDSDLDANTWENNRSGAPKQERRQDIYGATFGGPISRDRLFFFADYQGSRQDAPGFGTASVAPEAWRRGDLSGFAAVIRDPSHRAAVPRQPDPDRPDQRRGPRPAQRHGQLPAAQPHRAGRGHRQLRRRDAAQDSRPPGRRPGGLERLGQRQVLRPLLVCHLRGRPRRQPVPAGVLGAQRPAVLERRRQLEPHLRADHGQRAAGRLQPHQRAAGDLRLVGPRRRQRPLRHRRRPADRRVQRAGAGQRPHGARASRPRLGHAGHDLPDQREAHLAARAATR